MSFWRKDVIDFALSRETEAHIREQKEWIEREPDNPRPWFNLAQLYRMEQRQEEAVALLLEALRLEPTLADAHLALAEIYSVRADYEAARAHARKAEEHGNTRAMDLLKRYGLA